MTDNTKNRQQDWHIKVPRNKFPQPKFHFAQQIYIHWQDEQGLYHYDMGEIIGMQYNSSSNPLPEWSYLIRLFKSEKSSWLIGSDDGNFEYESNLVADYTSLEVKN